MIFIEKVKQDEKLGLFWECDNCNRPYKFRIVSERYGTSNYCKRCLGLLKKEIEKALNSK